MRQQRHALCETDVHALVGLVAMWIRTPLCFVRCVVMPDLKDF